MRTLTPSRAGLVAALATLAATDGRTVAQTTYTFTDQAAEIRPWYNDFLSPPNPAGTPNPTPDANGNWPNGGANPPSLPNAPRGAEPVSNPNNALVFPGSNPYTATNNLNPTLGNFQLNQLNLTATAGNPLVINGNPLDFRNTAIGAAPQITQSGGATWTIDTNVIMTNGVTINGSGGTVNIGDPILGGSTSGVISGGTLLTLAAANTVVLYGQNTYSGGTSVTGNGLVIVGNNNAFGTGKITFGGAAPAACVWPATSLASPTS